MSSASSHAHMAFWDLLAFLAENAGADEIEKQLKEGEVHPVEEERRKTWYLNTANLELRKHDMIVRIRLEDIDTAKEKH